MLWVGVGRMRPGIGTNKFSSRPIQKESPWVGFGDPHSVLLIDFHNPPLLLFFAIRSAHTFYNFFPKHVYHIHREHQPETIGQNPEPE